MNNEFFEALNLLETEKHIPKSYMIERVQAALASAFKHEFGNNTVIKVDINEAKRDIKVYSVRTVVPDSIVSFDPTTQIKFSDARKMRNKKRCNVGDEILEEVKTKDFGRISAQTAKQVIIQGIREAERKRITTEYENKKEEVITAEVIKIDENDGTVVLDTGKSHAALPLSEQIPGETFSIGQHVKVFVSQVNKETKGGIVTLTRIHRKLVSRLFELEVPEIQNGTVVIRNVVREPGSRSKIAVESRDPSVDPIGACIGPNGDRIILISNELNGEKIDIIPYSDVPEKYVKAALAPALVKNVEKVEEKTYRATVTNEQYSLAIGKEGQNVRLAVRLTGVKIDIKKE